MFPGHYPYWMFPSSVEVGTHKRIGANFIDGGGILKTNKVFGLASNIRIESYVDRGNLDSEVKKYLERETHIALNGASKCGKSWLRQAVI